MASECRQKDDYIGAFGYYAKGLMKAEDEGNVAMYVKCAGNISIIYHNFGDLDNSLAYAYKAYEAAQGSAGCRDDAIRIMTNIVSFYSQAADTLNASKFFRKLSKAISEGSSVLDGYFFIYQRAKLYRARHNIAATVKAYEEARRYAVSHRLPEAYVLAQDNELGKIMIEEGRNAEALAMGKKCLEAALRLKNRNMTINSYKMIAQAYEGLGVADSSLYYMNMYYRLNNKVYDMLGYFKVHNELVEYGEHKARKSIGRLVVTVVWVTALVVLLAGLLIAVYFKNKMLRDAQRLLLAKNEELQNAERNASKLLEKYVGTACSDAETLCSADGRDGEGADDDGELLSKDFMDGLLYKISVVLDDVSVISDPDFSLGALASKVGSNTKYVSIVINRMYNKNFKTLLSEYRVREACRRLACTDYDRFTIKTIACGVGFRNMASFIRCFKNVMGMTPSVYQRLSKEKGG